MIFVLLKEVVLGMEVVPEFQILVILFSLELGVLPKRDVLGLVVVKRNGLVVNGVLV